MTQVLENIEIGDIQSELVRRGMSLHKKMSRVFIIEQLSDEEKEAAFGRFLSRCEKTAAYAKEQGLTEEKLAELLRDE